MDTENKIEKFIKLFYFLQETKCSLSVSLYLTCVIHVSPCLTFCYKLEENLIEKLQEFLRKVGDEGLDTLYYENHFFIDYCVDKGWLQRVESVKHYIKKDIGES
jgi:hypothetical protein